MARIIGNNSLITLSEFLNRISNGAGSALSDPGANTIYGWDDTDNSASFWTIGSGLSFDHSTHTLTASGSYTGTTINNCAFVAKNGSDGTGTVGRLDLPYLTIAAAYAAISAGQTVVVYPGDYQFAASLTLVTDKHIYLIGKGTITLDTTGGLFNDPVFQTGGTAVTSCVIYGPGWDIQARSSQYALLINSSTVSTIQIDCHNFTSESEAVYNGKGHFRLNCQNTSGTDTPQLFYCWNNVGSLVVNVADTAEVTSASAGTVFEFDGCPYISITAKRIQQHASNSFYTIHSASSGANDKIYINAETIQAGTEWATFFEGSSSYVFVRAQRITANSDCVFASGVPKCYVHAELIESTSTGVTDGVVHAEGGEITVVGARIEALSAASGNVILASLTGGKVTLVGCAYDKTKISNTTPTDKRAIIDYTLSDGYVTVAASDTPNYLRVGANYICDGTGDESEINTALAISNVKLLPGTFSINIDNCIVFPGNNLELMGSGKGTIIKYGSGTAGGKLIKNDNAAATTGLTLRNFSIDGDLSAGYGVFFELVGSGEATSAISGATIKDLWITKVKQSGVELDSCRNCTLDNLKMVNTQTASPYYFDGIALRLKSGETIGCRYIAVSNCITHGCTAGIWMQYSDHITVVGGSYIGSSTNTAGQILIQMELCSSVTVNGATVRGSAENGIYADNTCSYIIVNGCTVSACTLQAIYIGGDSENCSVTNNAVHDTYATGISFNGNYGVVSGNKVTNAGLGTDNSYSGILVAGDYTAVTGNTITARSTTSSTSVAIPTSHPTTVTFTTDTSSFFRAGEVVKATNNGSGNFFKGTVTSYTPTTGVLVLSSTSNSGTGTYGLWILTLNRHAYGIDCGSKIVTLSGNITQNSQTSGIRATSASAVAGINISG